MMSNDLNALATSASEPVETAQLKEKFKARCIPLEKDFHDLIDMADTGRLAAGLSPEQRATKDTAKTGLIIDNDKRLAVNLKTNGGLEVTPDGISVRKGNGIDISVDAMTVKAKKNGGLEVTSDGISTSIAQDGGLVASNAGLGVKAGRGLEVTSEGIAIKLDPKSGLAFNSMSSALSLDLPSGWTIGGLIDYITSIHFKTLAEFLVGNPVGYITNSEMGTVIFTIEPGNIYHAYAFPATGVYIPTAKYNTGPDSAAYSPITIGGMDSSHDLKVFSPFGKEIGMTTFDLSKYSYNVHDLLEDGIIVEYWPTGTDHTDWRQRKSGIYKLTPW